MDGGFDEGGDINGGSWRVGTIDAELEAELCKYGNVKDLTIFAEKDNGKSKGYCQVEFHDPSAAMACQEGMNGHIFNGQPCVVAHATPISVRKKGAVQVRKKRELNQTSLAQPRSNAQGIGSGGITATPPLFHPQTMMGHGFGRGRIAATRPTLFHPQPMMGHGFRPAYRAHMGGPHRGFTAPSFSGFLPPSFPGVVPHVNPYFRGRGTPATGFVGHNFGMWTDPSAAGRGSDQEPIYGEEDASSKLQYGEGSHERGACSDASHRMGPDEKGPEIYLHVPMHLDDKEPGREKEYDQDQDQDQEREYDQGRDREREYDWDQDHGSRTRTRTKTKFRTETGRRETGSKNQRLMTSQKREYDWDRHGDRVRKYDQHRHQDRHRDHGRDREDRDRYSYHKRFRDQEPDNNDERDRGGTSRTQRKSAITRGRPNFKEDKG